MRKIAMALLMIATSLWVNAQGQFQALNLDNRFVNTEGEQVGAGYSGQWWVGPDADSLFPVGQVTPIVAAGILAAGVIDVPGIGAGADAAVQVTAWLDSDPRYFGRSSVAWITLSGGADIPPRATFDGDIVISKIPEPSTVALAVLGGIALLFSRLRKGVIGF